MDSPQKSSGQFSIDLSSFETQRLLFFDRFSVYRDESIVEIHFGFFGRSGQLQKGLIAVLSAQSLDEQKENLMQYLKVLGMPEPETLKGCDLRGGESDVITADVIGMARHGAEIAEVSFHTFSWKVVVETMRSGQGSIRPICAALLRCNLDLQRRLILDLYEKNTSSQ